MAATMLDVKAFFEPISLTEFKEFWYNLTDEEKEFYKNQVEQA